jgi:hypothetical protein
MTTPRRDHRAGVVVPAAHRRRDSAGPVGPAVLVHRARTEASIPSKRSLPERARAGGGSNVMQTSKQRRARRTETSARGCVSWVMCWARVFRRRHPGPRVLSAGRIGIPLRWSSLTLEHSRGERLGRIGCACENHGCRCVRMSAPGRDRSRARAPRHSSMCRVRSVRH